ncbi:MAG: PAS domain-containing protein [Desulfobacteraceae bacterium]|nr:PAS domain-containing protein [Desulfobacteraceae bacterium]
MNNFASDSNTAIAILDCIGDAISIQDTDFRILFQNRMHKNWIGSHTGEHCYKAFHSRESVCEGCPVAMVFKEGKPHRSVRRNSTDKGPRYVEVIASPLKLKNSKGDDITVGVEVARDITERVAAEIQRDDSRRILEDVAHGISESILLLTKDRKILWANDAAKKLAGQNIIGQFCYKATHRSDAPCNTLDEPCPLSGMKAYEEPKFVEHMHCDENGNRIFVEVSAYPIRNEAGEVDRFVHISRDITERKRIEAEREHLIKELGNALDNVRQLNGLLPICMYCKKIRDDKGYWNQIEAYISEHTEAEFSHGLCPECRKKYYPQGNEKK